MSVQKMHIVIASYGRAVALSRQAAAAFNNRKDVKITVLSGVLDQLTHKIHELESTQHVDVYVSSGFNLSLLKKYGHAPTIMIEASGSDLLNIMRTAMDGEKKIGIISFQQPVPIVTAARVLFDGEIIEKNYSDEASLDRCIEELREAGVHHVVGGILALEHAEAAGLKGYYHIGVDSMKEAVERALLLAEANREEKSRSERYRAILQFTHEGIIATNAADEIVEFNPGAEQLTGLKRINVIGKKVRDVIPNSRLDVITAQNKRELNQIQDIGPFNVITNRIPIIIDNQVSGALATFQNTATIHAAEDKIRREMRKRGFSAKTKFEDIIGQSPEIQRIKRMAELYAGTDSTVLITGESGTGKELFAQSIHNASSRSKMPFVAVNCATLSTSLLDSELFGYVGGAFTGAKKEGKRGYFELAGGGTIFLDEIAEIDVSIQVKLLRVLEQREIVRLGDEEVHPVDIRVIAATNKDLRAMSEEGTFRPDLYYRLNILNLHIPPLGERHGDIPVLAEHFLAAYCQGMQPSERRALSQDTNLLSYPWPGNVRQMRNLIERYSILRGEIGIRTISDVIDISDQPLKASPASQSHEKKPDEESLRRLIDECGGNRAEAARKLQVSRTTLWRWLKETGI